MSYTFRMTGSRLPIAVGSSSSLPLSFGTPRQLGKGRLQGSPFENITTTASRQGGATREGEFWRPVFALVLKTNLVFEFKFEKFNRNEQARAR